MGKRSCGFVATAALLFFINNIITTSALRGDGYEQLHTYNYAAKINVGVDGHVSEYHIDGHLKIQRDIKSNKYLLSLSDLEYTHYYGEKSSAMAIGTNPTHKNVLQIPFYAVYDEDGQFKRIENPRMELEPAWSAKIKKSIGSLLQFNWSMIKRGSSGVGGRDENMQLDEEVIAHGNCKVDYTITKMNQPSADDEKLLLTKSYSLNACDGFTEDIRGYLTNDDFTKKAVEDPIKWDQSSIRNAYELDFDNGVPTIKRISNFESYTYSDNIDEVVFMKDNRPLRVEIRQNLVFNSTSAKSMIFPHADPSITYTQFAVLYADSAQFNTLDAKEVLGKIVNLLEEAHTYMEKNHLEVIDEGAEHRQLFNKILSFLKRLKSDDFPLLESEIINNPNLDKHRKILISMLRYVGTKPCFDFILDMISRKAISDDLAIDLLTTLPIYGPDNLTSLEEFKSLVFDDERGETQLSPKVYETAVVSLSHMVNGRLGSLSPLGFENEVESYLPYFRKVFDAATTTSSKLAFLSALGNIRSRATAKYILPILTRRDDDARDQDRLRLAAINVLSELNSDEDVTMLVRSNLTAILSDKSESRAMRLAAYDALVSKSSYATDDLADFGKILYDDKDLYNYHLSTIEGLEQVGLLPRHARFQIDPSRTAVLSSLSRSVIVKMDNIVKPELLKSTLKIKAIPQTYLKLSFISEDQASKSDWRVPSVVKFEVLEERDKKLEVNKAVYLHTNFNVKVIDEGTFLDLWSVFNQNSRLYYADTIELKNLPNLLDLSDMIFQKIRERLTFMYQELTTFSLKTGLGVDAVFEHKYPSLVSMNMDYNWNADENYVEAKVDFSMKSWSNGYSGVSVHNPFSGLTHSIRKTQLVDGQVSTSVIFKYDFSKHQLNLTIPVNVSDPESKWTGLAIYSSTKVGIVDASDDISCESCGFKIASKHRPQYNLNFRRNDYLGVLASHMTYNCDPSQRLDEQTLFGNKDDGEVHPINTCGYIAMIRPNSSKPSSQIELLVNADFRTLKSMEKPWFFLPGYKLNFASSIGTRRIISNEVSHLLKLGFNVSTSQGHFLNLGQLKVVKRNEDGSNFVLCFDSKVDFPEIDDNHLPSQITQSNLKALTHFKIGQSAGGDSCSAAEFALDSELTGEVSEVHRSALEKDASQSLCMLQHAKWLYVYLREGSYPLTEACVREMISNTTLRRYKLDMTSEQFSGLSLLPALMIIRTTQDKLKEMVASSHNADVEVKMVSPLSDIRTKKRMSFQADYPVRGVYKNLPNIYFSQEFIMDFIDKKINVINVYPGLLVFNNEEKPFPESSEWIEVDTGVEKTPYKIYASVVDSLSISLKIVLRNYELVLKPKLVDSKKKVYVPQIYYNQQLFSEFHKRLHLFSTQEILFSLSRVSSRVDEYVVIRSNAIPVTIYYTTSSINIFQRT